MADVKISSLPSGTANASAVVPATNAAGTTTEKITLGAIAALGGGPPASHTHGNITNAGAIGTTSGLPVKTGTSGVLEAGAFGTTSGTFCQGNDSRLSDARAPTSHTHGNVTNAGAIGSTANLPVITTTSGVLTTGSFGTSANTFCQGNDSRLSDARTPTAHAASHQTGGTDELFAGSEINQGTLYLATVAEAVTGTDTAKAVTAQGASLSRRGSGRAKLWEVFTDFNGYQSSTVGASGGDGFLWYPSISNVTLGDTGYYTNSSGTDYRSGVLGMTSSTSGGYATLSFAGASGSTAPHCHRWDTGTTVAEAMVYMSALATASNDFVVRFGFLGTGSTAATSTGANWIEYNRSNSDYWAGCTYSSPTTTRELSSTLAATGWTRLRLEISSSGTITFYINGVAITNTLSAVAHGSYTNRTQMLGLAFNKTSTNSASVYWDYVYASHVFTADRT